ncbi:MAG TPA: hypothetical protein VNQ79_07950 [Blastocatellia bacterium]|nr:hypothetical protein [Blastocatellia bacterium]
MKPLDKTAKVCCARLAELTGNASNGATVTGFILSHSDSSSGQRNLLQIEGRRDHAPG